MDVIFISGIFMSFFIVLLLLTKKHKALTDKILAIWIAMIGIHLLGFYFYQLGFWEKYPHLIGITAPLPMFHGPLLYLYCLYTFRGEQKFRKADYLHFAPGIAGYLYMMNFFLFYSANEKLMVDRGEIDDFRIFSIVLLIAILISGLSYSILAYRLTLKHKQRIGDHFSYREGINLRWLRYCILSIGLVFLSAVLVFLLRDAAGLIFPFDPEFVIYLILIGFIFYLGYFGIKQENIFINNPGTADPISEQMPSGEKYKNSGMDHDQALALYEKLLRIMELEKPYLEPRLTLADLARRTASSPNHLSQVINQEAGVNFHDFINTYRVEEFLKLSARNKKYSLLALALESGFNSKSSFNHIFKKQKGLSPSQYISNREQVL